MLNATPQQLRRAADLLERIQSLHDELQHFMAGNRSFLKYVELRIDMYSAKRIHMSGWCRLSVEKSIFHRTQRRRPRQELPRLTATAKYYFRIH